MATTSLSPNDFNKIRTAFAQIDVIGLSLTKMANEGSENAERNGMILSASLMLLACAHETLREVFDITMSPADSVSLVMTGKTAADRICEEIDNLPDNL